MSQSPYAQLSGDFADAPLPQRTSALAIISLVIGIISIVPLLCLFVGSGTLAMIFGGAALLMIHRERGRLGGTGLAATGIVLGLLVSVAQVAAVILLNNFMSLYNVHAVGPIDESLRAMRAGDYVTARKLFTPEADAKLSDQMMMDFDAAYRAHAGEYQGSPSSIVGLVQAWLSAGPSMRSLKNGAANAFPYVANFSKGPAVVIVVIDSNQQGPQGGPGSNPGMNFVLPTLNIGVLTTDGKATWLNDTMPTPGPKGVQMQRKRGDTKVAPSGEDGPEADKPEPPSTPEPPVDKAPE